MMLYRRPKGGYEWWRGERSKVFRIMQATDRAFPGLNQAIDLFAAKKGPTALPCAMQRRESDVFIGKALPRMQILSIPVAPIHDRFLCRAMDAPLVREILEDELEKATGLHPTLKIGKAIC